jgi:hypothetical protein
MFPCLSVQAQAHTLLSPIHLALPLSAHAPPLLAPSLRLQLLSKYCQSTHFKYIMQATYPVRYSGAVITTQQRTRYNNTMLYMVSAERLAVKLF